MYIEKLNLVRAERTRHEILKVIILFYIYIKKKKVNGDS